MIRYVRLSRLALRRVDILTFVVGFAIGAGILGLPVKFGVSGAGFIPSVTMLLLILLFQVITAIYVVEVIDSVGPKEFPKLMSDVLGRWAGVTSYFFIAVYLVGAMTAYVVFGGQAIFTMSHGLILPRYGMIAYWIIGVALTIGGAKVIARAEEIMVALIMMLLALNILLCVSTPYASISNLTWGDWRKALSVFGVVLFAFAIHSAIPTAYRSFGIDTRYDRLLAAGLGISAVVYVAWSAAYMSILTPADYSKTFVGALTGKTYHGIGGLPAPVAVAELGKLRVAALLGYVFGFFTTLTSFIAAAHCLHQINLDILKPRTRGVRAILLTLATVPPAVLALTNVGSFTSWLSFSGAIGAAVFTGILPSLAAIVLRVKGRRDGFTPLIPGGVPLAVVTLVFYLVGIAWYVVHG